VAMKDDEGTEADVSGSLNKAVENDAPKADKAESQGSSTESEEPAKEESKPSKEESSPSKEESKPAEEESESRKKQTKPNPKAEEKSPDDNPPPSKAQDVDVPGVKGQDGSKRAEK